MEHGFAIGDKVRLTQQGRKRLPSFAGPQVKGELIVLEVNGDEIGAFADRSKKNGFIGPSRYFRKVISGTN
jgi:hypothetical protein